MVSGSESPQHELGLPAAQMENSRYARRNRIAQRCEIVIDEEMVVSCAFSLFGGRSDLDTARGKDHGDVGTVRHRPIGRLKDFDAGVLGWTSTSEHS